MKSSLLFLMVLISQLTFSQNENDLILISQTSIFKFNNRISFEMPDNAIWILKNDKLPEKDTKGVISYLRRPIYDSLNREIRPMMAIIYEKLNDTLDMDVITYSVNFWAYQNSFQIRYNLLGGYPDYSSDKYSVMFDGIYYREGVKHKVLVGFILRDKIGLIIICDSTNEVFAQVESDMKKFEKSVHIKD